MGAIPSQGYPDSAEIPGYWVGDGHVASTTGGAQEAKTMRAGAAAPTIRRGAGGYVYSPTMRRPPLYRGPGYGQASLLTAVFQAIMAAWQVYLSEMARRRDRREGRRLRAEEEAQRQEQIRQQATQAAQTNQMPPPIPPPTPEERAGMAQLQIMGMEIPSWAPYAAAGVVALVLLTKVL